MVTVRLARLWSRFRCHRCNGRSAGFRSQKNYFLHFLSKNTAPTAWRGVAVALTCLLLGLAGRVQAQTKHAGERRVALLFKTGAAACAQEATFRKAVRARDRRIRWAATAPVTLRIEVQQQPEAKKGAYLGTLRIVDRGKDKGGRRVEGACDDVLQALALFAVMALHGEEPQADLPGVESKSRGADGAKKATAQTDKQKPQREAAKKKGAAPLPKGQAQPSKKTRPSAPDKQASGKAMGTDQEPRLPQGRTAKSKPKATKPSDKSQRKPAEQVAAAVKQKPAPSVSRRPEVEQGTWSWGLEAGVGASSSLRARLDPYFPLGVTLERQGRALWSPSFRLGFRTSTPATVQQLEGEVSLWRIGGSFAGCPLRLSWLQRLDFRPCLALQLAGVDAQSSGFFENDRAAALLISTEASGGLGVRLDRRWQLRLRGAGGLSVLRPRFAFGGAAEADALQLPIGYGSFSLRVHIRLD